MNSSSRDLKRKQLLQSKQKRKILEETIAGTSAETELLQSKLKNLQHEKEKLDQQIHEKQKIRDIFSGDEFQKWWNDGVLKWLHSSSEKSKQMEDQIDRENAAANNNNNNNNNSTSNQHNFHEMIRNLSHLRESHKKYCSNFKKSSASSTNSSFSGATAAAGFGLAVNSGNHSNSSFSAAKYYNPLLKETSSMLSEMQSLESSTKQTQSGPLSQLEERHKQLDGAIADARRKTLRLNMEADRQERLILIDRYRAELPQLRQELASRPKASDVAEFKQRMVDQIQMLSSEMNEVLGELQLFEKREEVEQELENQLKEGAALRIEIASFQEQISGLVEFAASQKENIRQWNETEKPRHEGFIANLERERDQLKRDLKMFNIPVSKNANDDDENDDVQESKHGNDNDDVVNEIVDVNNIGAVSSPRRLVHVVHFDGSSGIQEVETRKAPTKRWHRSAKFLSEGNSTSGETRRLEEKNGSEDDPSSDDARLTIMKAHHHSPQQSTTFMSQTLKILSDIYVPPMVEFTASVSEKTGCRKDDRTEAASLTVRVLSKLSSWMFGDSSWVEKGRKTKKKLSVEVVV